MELGVPAAFGGALAVKHQALVDEFNRSHPDVKVNAAYAGSLWSMRDKLLLALAAGAGPDVANIDQYWLPALADGGYAVPLRVGEHSPRTPERCLLGCSRSDASRVAFTRSPSQ